MLADVRETLELAGWGFNRDPHFQRVMPRRLHGVVEEVDMSASIGTLIFRG